MKFLNLMVAVAAMAALVLISGCSSSVVKPLSPAQVAAIACPQINLATSQLTAFNAVLIADPTTAYAGANANATLAALQPTIAAVCAASATVTSTNLQALAQEGLPALATIVGSLPLPAAQQAQVQGALVLAETAMGLVGVVESQVKAAQAAAASAPPVPVASPAQ